MMKINKIQLDVVSQEKHLLTEEVDSVNIETLGGELTILPNHTPLLTRLNEGILTYEKNGKSYYVAIFGGFMDVAVDNQVTVLADSAARAESIDIAKVERAKQEAEEAAKNQATDQEAALIESQLRKTALELRVAKKHQSLGSNPKI